MEASYYWLISTTAEAVSVALIKRGTPNVLVALGPETEWLPDNPDSFLHSVDISLSAAAEKAALEPDQEPETSAFILPPKWIGNDGKIFPEYLKLLESLCRSLKLKPLGFISNDEAFIESLSKEDSFPPSFILVYLGLKEFSLSLVYLGEVKKRFHQVLSGDFTPQDLENALVTVRLDSALPPRILVFGHLSPSIVDDLKNYSWIGKKNIETFLHLPDVEAYQPEELFSLYCKTVSSQIEGNSDLPSEKPTIVKEETPEKLAEPAAETMEEMVQEPDEETVEMLDDTEKNDEETEFNQPDNQEIDEVAPEDLGFSEIKDSDSIVLSTNLEPAPFQPPKEKVKLPSFSFPRFSLPSLNFNPWLLFPLALSPLLLLIPYFLMKSEVTINFNPIEINKNFNLTLDSTSTSISATNIPALKKTVDIKVTQSIATTGQKETGDKAKGKITIFNKDNKIQNVPKGTILSDNTGKKFELLTSVQIPASTYDLNTGNFSMSRSEASIVASDIGPEFNINKDSVLNFKDNDNLLGKVNDGLSGGSKRQIKVVATDDKTKLNKLINDAIPAEITKKINSESNLAGLMIGTTFIDKKQLDYNREIGEEADTLDVSANLTLSMLQIDPAQKDNIIKTLFANDQEFIQSVSSPSDFSYSFAATQTTSQKSVGKLTVTGKTLPKIDINAVKKRLAGQKIDVANKIMDSYPRVYNHNIDIIPKIFTFLKRLPPSGDKITIIEKF